MGGGVEVETIDISQKIPEAIKLLFDRSRVREILGEKGKIDDVHVGEKELHDLINTITKGAFYDTNKINTVLLGNPISNGLGRKSSFSVGNIKDIPTDEQDQLHYLSVPSGRPSEAMVHFPVERAVNFPEEELRDVGVWFAAGGSEVINGFDPIVICDPFSDRFLRRVYSVEFRGDRPGFKDAMSVSSKRMDGWEPDNLAKYKKIIEAVNEEKYEGAEFMFHETNTDVGLQWKDIAEWIVDLPEGKLYKCKQIGEKSAEAGDGGTDPSIL